MRILAGSECVARMPPMACLFEPWPALGIWSMTSVRIPSSAMKHGRRRAHAARADDDDVVEFLRGGHRSPPSPSSHPANVPSGTSMNSGRMGLVHDLLFRNALLAEEAMDERRAGLGAARAHAGPRHGLDFVDVAVALADQGADLARASRARSGRRSCRPRCARRSGPWAS